MSRLAGNAARHVRLTAKARNQLLVEVAGVLRTVHNVDVTTVGSAGNLPAIDDALAVKRCFEHGFAEVVDDLASRDAAAILRPRQFDVADAAWQTTSRFDSRR